MNVVGIGMRQAWRLAVAAMAILLGSPARADDYPARPVTIIAPSQPGGGFDLIGRVAADVLSRQLGKTFLVENRTGSGTLVGTQAAAAAAPDGYTLLIGGLSNLVFNAALYKTPRYNPRTDFATIDLIASYPYVLVARSDLPVKNFQELMAYAKAHPDKLSIATGGAGSGQHILAAALIKETGTRITVVPYRGAQGAYQDVLGGRIDLFIDVLPTIRPHVDSKRVKALFTTSAKRVASLPDVPTVKELALPALEAGSWFGLFTPAKTPAPVIDQLRKALHEGMKDTALRDRLEKSGVELLDLTPAQSASLIASEYDKWTAFIRQAGITLD